MSNTTKISWADQKMEELNNKGRDQWDECDWSSYTYIQQTRFESGYYDDES